MTTNNSAGVWVKASERLPDREIGNLPLKCKGRNYIGHFWFYSKYFWFPFGCIGTDYDDKPVPEDFEKYDVQWLDEDYESPAESTLNQIRSILSVGEGEDVVEKVRLLLNDANELHWLRHSDELYRQEIADADAIIHFKPTPPNNI